jgi:hypothetical protein
MSLKASLPPDVIQPYSGALIDSLLETVEKADGASAAMRAKSGAFLVHKQDGRNYLRLTELPPHVEIHCSTADCSNQARLLIDARDQEVLPYCRACAHVEFSMWMVGV